MEYPIVKIKTADNIINHGLFIEAEKSESVFIFFHGTAGNFYDDDFVEVIAKKIVPEGVSLLSTNNRGSGVYDIYARKGSAVEIFENCIFDIDAWIEFVIQKGYKKIILCGHSLGVEKIIYFMSKGAYRDKINGIIMLSPADSSRWRLYDENYKPSEQGKELIDNLLSEAQQKIDNNQGDELMDTNLQTGFMPRIPASVMSILGEKSELIKVLPFHSGSLEMLRGVEPPICVIIGNKREYTGISPEEALNFMKNENSKIETHLIENANHFFTGFENEVSEIVRNFITKKNY